MLRPGRAAAADQNVRGGDGERGSQPVAHRVYRTGYATCGMPLLFGREVWRRYLANDVDCFVLVIFDKQYDLTIPRQDAKSAVSEGVSGVVEGTVEPEPSPEEDEDWE